MGLHKKYKGLVYHETEMVGEHLVVKPPLPDNPKQVFFIDDDAEDAFWDRDRILKDYRDIWFKFIPNETLLTPTSLSHIYPTEYDEDGFAISYNEEDSNYMRWCYDREWERRTQGVFFRNENEIEWITGDHWFVLMWCKTKRPDKRGDYFDFREFQQKDVFYLIVHTNISNYILGCDWSKAKKTGLTNLIWLYYLNKATMTKNINLGNMNIDQDKGAKTFRDHFIYAYNGLPLALRPEFKTKKENDGVITFGKRYTSKKSNRIIEDDELNTTVSCVATALNAFDVDVFSDIWYDEGPKYKSDFGAIYRSNSGGTKIQDLIIGKQWQTSYTPEKSGDSFLSAKKLFYDSELKTITTESNGRTISMLICHHIPAYKSWASSFNKYGKCDEADARKKIEKELEIVSDRPHEYLKKRREYANTKKDAWSVGDSSSIYDPIRLAELEFDLELLQRSQQTFEQGELQWGNPMWEVGKKDKRPKGVFCPVKWVPLTKEQIKKGGIGKMRQYEPISNTEQNLCLSLGKDEYGNLLPPPKFAFCGGVDPADFRDAGNFEEGSMVGITTMAVHDTTRNTLAQRVVTKIDYYEYLARPDNPEEWYQDIVKQIIYTGMLVIVEANNGTIATRLEDEGLGHYMLFKNTAGVIQQYVPNHKNNINPLYPLKHIKNTKSGNVDTVADMIVHFKSYLLPGKSEYDEIDYGKLIKSERLLKQLKEFDPANTKPFDLHMSKGYALMAHDNYIALLSVVQDDRYTPNEINAVVSALEKYF